MEGKPLSATYDGYAACPILVGGKKVIMAEFKYGGEPSESFGGIVDQSQARHSFYFLKKVAFPFLYWNLFLRGLWFGPTTIFKPKFDTN
ncbi:hypothetical protein CYMTET_4815 [Cymbomonas tetramitiformis]|uniref:Uncharacterized protein n=1 Tax=Cymbomonas tetramitiformis TaxID=36881 RepID=A0AAE0H0F2_9CHLO|nr:hypothetical protein CYMTET_4815 [Cymbomonas tetramitiformis]